jgi:CRISPR-associated protein Csd1
MSWMQKLYATYEACAKNPAFIDPPQTDAEKETPALMPVSHVSQQAHIHVMLDGQGNFLDAELLPLKKQIVIPATEESASRTGNPAPHPLADKIHYCAKDYAGAQENLFDNYMAQLKSWCASPYSHPKALAVHAYIARGVMVRDLLKKGILLADNTGTLVSQAPVGKSDSIFKRLVGKKKDQGNALVVWSVQTPGDMEPRTWKDKSLQEAWVRYDASQTRQKPMLCMIEGKETLIIGKHPRNIRRPGDGAKLISSNDKDGFTFRGRFIIPEEACTVGYNVSHKAHNALRWLIARQGYRNGEQAVVAWAEKGLELPNPVSWPPPEDFDWSLDEALSPETTIAEPEATHKDVGQSFSRSVAKALRGYRANFGATEGVAILALDSASPGRLSVTFYRERMAGDYLGRLEQWQEDMAWTLPFKMVDSQDAKKAKARTVFIERAPLPETIARVAHGRRIDDELLKTTVARLLPCIVDGTPIPRDLVESCVRRACNRTALEAWEWGTVLGTACALYKGFYARHPQPQKRRIYAMALDRNRTTRDYLYGRLLAVAEYAERSALDKAGEKRPTNAERLMQRFADNPCATWLTLEKQLSPYMQRLQGYEPSPYKRIKREMQEIIEKCDDINDFTSSKCLDGEFLLGYHCQLADFYKKREAIVTQEGEEQ